ncbi:hypothetical protein MNBD_GAMMA11-1693 [hydrothermal vent metagenome]|uniref:Uncharacterized protein n=1 Tax=hydrothermal vent metagenome TaxID=652676 RepID=A0A3B0XLK0_9ZZZZ
MLAIKDINDNKTSGMVRFCKKHGYILRLIKTMPVGNTGKEASKNYLDLHPAKKTVTGGI